MAANPLLDDLRQKLPGVRLTLPTAGLFYAPGVLSPAADPSNLVVRAFSMWQEIEFRDPYKIASGKAVEDMLRVVTPEVLRPADMASIDVDAIMIAARLASYGPRMDMDVTCNNPEEVEQDGKKRPKCRHVSQITVDLNKAAMQYQPIGTPDQYQVEFPNRQVAQIRPLAYRVMSEMMKATLDHRRKFRRFKADDELPDELVNEVVDTSNRLAVTMVRESIMWVRTSDGRQTDDQGIIAEWLDVLPSDWAGMINDKIEEMASKTKGAGTVDHRCPECGHTQEGISVISDHARFFGRASRSSTQRR